MSTPAGEKVALTWEVAELRPPQGEWTEHERARPEVLVGDIFQEG